MISLSVSFMAIIPLAKVRTMPAHTCNEADRTVAQMLAFATDELSMRVGQTLAGLMNATLVRRNVSLF